MRSCEEMELLMNLYLDNLLPSEESRLVEEHLKECQACRETFQQLSAIKDALGQLEEPLPEGLHERILDYVEKNGPVSVPAVSADPKIIRPRRWLRTLTAVAACAVIAVAAIRFVPMWSFQPNEAMPDNRLDAFSYSDKALLPALPEEPAAPAPAPQPQEQVQMNSQMNSALPQPAPEPESNEQPVGPLAEDLPPLVEMNKHEDKQMTVRKWLLSEGSRSQLPDWAEAQLLQITGEDQVVYTYAIVDHWNEDYWKDQLTPCGFVFSDLEGEDLIENGQKLLIFFRFTE